MSGWMLTLVVITCVSYWMDRLAPLVGEIVESINRRRRRRKRVRDWDKWAAARGAAREEVEARMRAEGRWDNFEIQDAMDAAGERAVPGFRPW